MAAAELEHVTATQARTVRRAPVASGSWHLRTLAVVAAVAVWGAGTGGLGWRPLPPALLPSPAETWHSLVAYARSGLLALDVGRTLAQAFLGLGLGMVVGTGVGVALAYARRLGDALEPLLAALNSLPRVAVAPLLIIWFGLGITSKVLLAFFTVVFVVFMNTYAGVRSVDPDLVRAVQAMGGDGRHVARWVVLPWVASWVFAALRTSISLALAATVTGEFVGSTHGLGYRMVLATGVLDTPRVFAILLVLMTVGYTVVEAARRVEAYLLRWRPEVAV
ncbi:MAG: ABC transporter permease subunit [Armatimonadota bacterium]|nr:ABC transporter permease subunit [Armatimonadota bacterium]MDW8155900.1 ABC transporter permease subunit [Armatimonadota bacterium]